jgi:hypothetical protein
MPNNIIYEHDYRKEKEERISQTHSENSDRAFQLAQDTGVYKAIGDRIRALPHVLNPRKKEAYEKTLAILERYAAHWGGYIKGTISYEIFDSYLYLDLPFHEFVNRDNMDELIFIAQNARSICFSTEENGLIRMAVHIDYFEEIGDIDAIIEEEVLKRPELCDALIESHESEIEAILANPKLVSMLEPQAEKLGLTVEEFARKLDQALVEHPDEFIDIMTEAFRKRHDKNYREE